MAILELFVATRDGADLVASASAAAVGGDGFPNADGQSHVVVTNASGADISVTFVIQATVDGQETADRVEVVPAASTVSYGPFQKAFYNDANGRVQMTYSSAGELADGGYGLTNPALGMTDGGVFGVLADFRNQGDPIGVQISTGQVGLGLLGVDAGGSNPCSLSVP